MEFLDLLTNGGPVLPAVVGSMLIAGSRRKAMDAFV
jgi:hypothetical protein